MMTNEEFLARLDRTGECWLWTGGVSGRYGKVYLGTVDGVKQSARAHRLAYEMLVGPVGDLHVCHRCDVPLCCRPEHLFLGTNADNTADRVAKGRTRTWATERTRLGSAHPRAKVTEEQVVEIRARNAAGETTVALAREFGLSQASCWAICRRRSWTHV